MSIPAQTDNNESVTPLEAMECRILAVIHAEFPLCRSPYRVIAERTGLAEGQVRKCISALRKRGYIRRIGGVLNTKKLGLTGTLVAMKVPSERIEEVAAIVNAVSNVTHNYLRDHEYNMWFTVTANSRGEVSRILAQIKDSTGIQEMLDLPSLRTFKIGVKLDFNKPCSMN